MKTKTILILCLLCALLLTACGAQEQPAPAETKPAETSEPAKASEPVTAPVAPEPEIHSDDPDEPGESVPVVLYFSRMGNTDFPADMDAVASASTVVSGGTLMGNAQLLASWAADELGVEAQAILTEPVYPGDYNETIDQAKQEQKDKARPAITSTVEGLADAETVYLVFPNWWGDLPMALYTFFEENDFAGKTLHVTITHGGSGFSKTLDTIRLLEPECEVIEGLSVSANKVPNAEEQVRAWVRGS